MTTGISHNINIGEFSKFSNNLFEVETCKSVSDKSNTEVKNVNAQLSDIDLKETDMSRPSSIHEAEDTVPELDPHEIELRQKEANEETTKSEDLRKFLNEMHQTFEKEGPQLELLFNRDNQTGSVKNPNNMTTSTPGSPGYYNDNSPYKQIINPYVDADIEAMAAETAPIGPPDGGWAWFIVLASFFCMITIDGTCFNYGLLVPAMMEDFNHNKIMSYMWPGSLISGFYMTLGPVASALSNQFNFRPVAMAGALISGVAILLSTFVNNIVGFIFLFGMCGGVGFSLIYLPAIAVVGHWFHEKRPIAVGMALCGSGFGTLVFGQLIPYLIHIFTWRGTVILIAAVCIQSLVFISLFRPLELHLRMTQYSKILQSIKQIQKEENERKRLDIEKMAEEERRRKKAEKDHFRQQQRMKNKRIVIYRGSIMQKIIEEKKRQRTVSMGSLDGMVITGDNELVKVAMSSVDIYEKPILSVNAINRIKESVVKRLENKLKKHGPNGVVSIGDSRSTIATNNNVSNVQIKNSLPQLVQDYINSQVSLQVCGTSCGMHANGTILNGLSLQRQNSIQSSINRNDDTTSRTSSHQNGFVLEEKAKAVIQASLRKEITRPFCQKELLFTGSMKQLSIDPDMDKRSQNSSNFCNRSINSHVGGGIIGIPTQAGCAASSVGGGTVASSSIQEDDYVGICDNEGDFAMIDDTGIELDDECNIQQNPQLKSQAMNRGIFHNFMRELLDISLLTSPTFILMIVSSITAMLGIFVPFFLLPLYLNSLNISLTVSGQLISYVGIANTAGRLISTVYIEKAWASSHKLADCLWINNAALLLAGASACSIPLLINFYPILISVLVLYGVCVAAFVSLKSILVVELLGLNRLTNSFSFLLIFQGLATVFGPPIAGCICDVLNEFKYESAFYYTGAMIILSGLLCFPLRMIAQYERRKNGIFDDQINDEDQRYSPISNQCMDEQAVDPSEYQPDNEPQCSDCLNAAGDNNISANNSDNTKDYDNSIYINKNIDTADVIEDVVLEPLVEEEEDSNGSDKQPTTKRELFEVTRVNE